MTKRVRIENADNSDFRVVVEVWDKVGGEAPDVLAQTIELNYPTAMTNDLYLTSTRYFVVKEAPKSTT